MWRRKMDSSGLGQGPFTSIVCWEQDSENSASVKMIVISRSAYIVLAYCMGRVQSDIRHLKRQIYKRFHGAFW